MNRAAALVLMTIVCGFVWLLVALVLLSSVQPANHFPM